MPRAANKGIYMTTRVLRATIGDQFFTRRTANTYSHTVVALPSFDQDLADAEINARDNAALNHGYYVRESGANPQFTHTEVELARIRRIGGLTQREWYLEQLEAARLRIEGRSADGYYGRYINQGWHSRIDLAQRNATECAARGLRNVTILAV